MATRKTCFMGTTITAGRGKAIVVETDEEPTGSHSRHAEDIPTTPLQKRLGKLGRVLGIAAGIIVIAVF